MARALLASLVLTAPASALALTLAPMSLAEMTRAADVVVWARCVDRTTTRSGESGGIESIVRFEVLDVAKGAPGDVVEVRQPGGELDGTVTVVPGAPLSDAGDEAILFLEHGPGGHLRVVGMALGYLPVASLAPRSRRVRVAPYLGKGFEGGGLRPVDDVMNRVRRVPETSR